MDIQSIASRLSKIDGRPHHPEDYIKNAENINKHMEMFETTIDWRLGFLETNGDLYRDIMSAEDFLLNGILRDSYTGQILYEDEGGNII